MKYRRPSYCSRIAERHHWSRIEQSSSLISILHTHAYIGIPPSHISPENIRARGVHLHTFDPCHLVAAKGSAWHALLRLPSVEASRAPDIACGRSQRFIFHACELHNLSQSCILALQSPFGGGDISFTTRPNASDLHKLVPNPNSPELPASIYLKLQQPTLGSFCRSFRTR